MSVQHLAVRSVSVPYDRRVPVDHMTVRRVSVDHMTVRSVSVPYGMWESVR